MEKRDIFTKTAKGTRALQDCKRFLSQNECRILSLVNGTATLEDIQALLNTMSAQAFQISIELLMKEDYVRQLSRGNDGQHGPASQMGVIELNTEQGVREWAAATRAADALTREGYYLTQEDKQPCNGPQQILVIDDAQAIGEVVSMVLGGAGFAVEWIGDPLVAIDKIKSMPCLVLVLLDVMMPAENGFDVLRKIRAQPSMRKLPVVMLTGHETPEYVAEGLRGGADGYILKPFRPEKLIQYLHATLKTE